MNYEPRKREKSNEEEEVFKDTEVTERV